MTSSCRVCGFQHGTTLNLFLTKLKPDLTLHKAYVYVTNIGIEFDDGKTTEICCQCSARLSDAYNLKIQAEETHRHLHKLNVEYLEEHDVYDDSEQRDNNASKHSHSVKLKSDTTEQHNSTQQDDESNSSLFAKTDCVPKESSSFIDVDSDHAEDAVQFLKSQMFNEGGNKMHSPSSAESRKKRTTQKPGTHKCRVCDRLFLRQSNLVDHLRLHANVRLFRCDDCDKSFVQLGNYRTHLRTHSNERPYQCPMCPKAYSQSSTLKIHIRYHTKERNYRCSECGKAFTNATDLGKHKRLHDPNKQFKCDVCDHKFAQKVNMLKHVQRKHTGQKPNAETNKID